MFHCNPVKSKIIKKSHIFLCPSRKGWEASQKTNVFTKKMNIH